MNKAFILLLTFTLFSCTQKPVQTSVKPIFDYRVTDTYVEIKKFIGGEDIKEVTIPNSIENLPVKILCNRAFEFSKIEKVIFEEDSPLVLIEDSCFASCSNLTEIEFPSNLKTIEKEVFYECTSLTQVNFENADSLKTIGENAFSYSELITTLDFNESLIEVQSEAFIGLKNLTTINFKQNIKKLGYSLFSGCYEASIVFNGINELQEEFNPKFNFSETKVKNGTNYIPYSFK